MVPGPLADSVGVRFGVPLVLVSLEAVWPVHGVAALTGAW